MYVFKKKASREKKMEENENISNFLSRIKELKNKWVILVRRY
jgi:hypothetical protein